MSRAKNMTLVRIASLLSTFAVAGTALARSPEPGADPAGRANHASAGEPRADNGEGPYCIENNLRTTLGQPSFLSENGSFAHSCMQGEKWTFFEKDGWSYCLRNDLLARLGQPSYLSDNGAFYHSCMEGETWSLQLQADDSYCLQNDLLARDGQPSFLSDNGAFYPSCMEGERWTIYPA